METPRPKPMRVMFKGNIEAAKIALTSACFCAIQTTLYEHGLHPEDAHAFEPGLSETSRRIVSRHFDKE